MNAGARAGRVITGVYQDPSQLAAAMERLARLSVRSYLELGVNTAWTTALIAPVLLRAGGGRRFEGLAVDIDLFRIDASTRRLLRELSVRVVTRARMRGVLGLDAGPSAAKRLPAKRLPTNRTKRFPVERDAAQSGRPAPIDFCFIDADHSYAGVRADYEELAPHCAHVMFHDVLDFSSWLTKDHGVPGFWAHLKANVRSERVVEITQQQPIYPPAFGIGLLYPNANGTATAEHGLERQWVRASGAENATCVGCSSGAGDCADYLTAAACKALAPILFKKHLSKHCKGRPFLQRVCQRTCGLCHD